MNRGTSTAEIEIVCTDMGSMGMFCGNCKDDLAPFSRERLPSPAKCPSCGATLVESSGIYNQYEKSDF